MARLLFEDPFWLYVLLGLTEAGLVWSWHHRRDRTSALRLVWPPAAALLLLALASAVTTDRERIRGRIDALSGQLTAGRTDDLVAGLADDFTLKLEGIALDRKTALALLRAKLRPGTVQSITIQKVDTEVRGDAAESTVQAQVQFGGARGEAFSGRMPLRVQLTWVKVGKAWLLRSTGEPMIGIRP
jgi:hypothetical protein